MTHLPDTQSTVVEVPDYIPIDALAKAFRVDMGALQVLNPALRPPIWNGSRFVPRGYGLRLPGTQQSSEIAEAWARLPPAQRYVAQRNDGVHKVRRGETVAGVAAPPREPVSERQAESTALLPAAAPTGNGDATDYRVRADNTVIVQPDETLGHFADWARVSSDSLRSLNKLHKNAMVTIGHKVKLDLSKVSADEFAGARRDYHRHVQDEFFATHKIAATTSYAVKRGDSLWIIAQQHGDLPVWLISQYNPDANLADMRPGTTITLPQIAAINRQ
jgi:LysM repeat protein